MGKAMFDAASNGNEAELTRLIGLGGSVNWRDGVRRRMCLAWAPASSPPLLLSPPRSPDTAPCPQSSLHRARPRWLRRHPAAPPSLAHAMSPQLAVQRAAALAMLLAMPPPRRPAELGTRVPVAWRAPHPRVLAHAPRVLWHSMTPRVLHLPSTEAQL
jgi:hypothetical protein